MCLAASLRGNSILITRPRHQSEHLRWLIEKAGGEAVVIPTMEIVDPTSFDQLSLIGQRLAEFDIAIFISANAVRKGLEWLRGCNTPWPDTLQVAAVGQATAKALEASEIAVSISPAGKFDSEHLLMHPAMENVADKKIIIFRGQGGREHLASILKERGASVEYAEVYVRRKPDINLSEQLDTAQRNKICVIVTTSNEGLTNLIAMTDLDWRGWLFATNLIVLSERGARKAQELGFQNVTISPQASDDAIMGTIKRIIEHCS